LDSIDLYAKLESYNPTGSIKDRPAAHIIRHLLLSGKITKDTVIIESSSGNFGIALASICRAENLKFVCVIDPIILEHNEFLLAQYGAEIIKVSTKDDTGGYLKSRIKRINEFLKENPNAIWLNQYSNDRNAMSHYYGTGMEIYKDFADIGLDYVFVPVSSGGTIAGVSKILKEQFPNINIVAVDTVGSVIFSEVSKQRYIPGMGSSIQPELVKQAKIDHIVSVEELDIVSGCTQLLHDHGLFVGGSSGAVYMAAKQYFSNLRNCVSENGSRVKCLLIFPDRGERYSSTIYNKQWVSTCFPTEHLSAAGTSA
jgi:cysteine synthase A